MEIKDILTLIATVASFLLTCLIPTVIVMINRIKAVRKAKTEAEKEAAINDLKDYLIYTVVPSVEDIYDKFKGALTNGGGENKTFAEAKHDSAISKLQSYAISKNYAFDMDWWGNEIGKFIDVTKTVNASDKAKAEVKAKTKAQEAVN